MANIKLKELLEANVDPKLVARSKKTGKLVYFKSPEAKANAVKAGSHEEPKKDKKTQAKQAAQSADMFKGDYSKERGAKDDSNWMDDLDKIDTSDIKGKADPNADSFTGYKTDGDGNILYKGKKVADYTYDDITDEFTLRTKDGIKVFDTHNDMYKYLQKNKSENPSLSSKLMSMFKK